MHSTRPSSLRWRGSFALALALATLLLLAACGGDDADNSTVVPSSTVQPTHFTEVDVCSLLTIDEVGNALGGTAGAGVPGEPVVPPEFYCDWTSEDDSNISLLVLGGNEAEISDTYDDFPGEEIPGLGLRAKYNELGEAEALIDGYYVSVSISSSSLSDVEVKERSIELLSLALSRLAILA